MCHLYGELCNDTQICIDSEESNEAYKCKCKQGYTGESCTDIDECSQKNKCDPNAECINTPGSFVCVCKPGFTGDGYSCIALEMCDSYAYCQQICKDIPGSYKCSCKPGFVLQPDQINCKSVEKCSKKTCITPSYCVVDHGKEECVCPVGYILNDAKDGCKKKDTCADNPCDRETTNCVASVSAFSCECKAGYYRPLEFGAAGHFCLKKTTCIKPCPTIGGICLLDPSNNDYVCGCRSGYRGDGLNCIVDDVCTANKKCDVNNAVCQHTYASPIPFRCACRPGYIYHGKGDLEYCEYQYSFLYKGVITLGFPEKLSTSMCLEEKEAFIRKDLEVAISRMFSPDQQVYIEPNLKSGEIMVYVVDLSNEDNLIVNAFNNKLNTECLKRPFPSSSNGEKYCMIGSVIVKLGIKPAFNYQPCRDLMTNCNPIIHDCIDQDNPKNGMYCRCKKHYNPRELSYNMEICERDEKLYCDVYPPLCDKPLQECVEITDGYECRCTKNTILDNRGNCVDICYNITCHNDGECVDGNCICPEEFLGRNCEKKNPFEKEYEDAIDSIKALSTALGVLIILFLGSLVFMIERKCNKEHSNDNTNDSSLQHYSNHNISLRSEE